VGMQHVRAQSQAGRSAWGFERRLWGTDWTRAFAVVNYEQAVEPFRQTDRLSDSERAMLMGGACVKAYGWSPSKARSTSGKRKGLAALTSASPSLSMIAGLELPHARCGQRVLDLTISTLRVHSWWSTRP
jgi:hypothetical protein